MIWSKSLALWNEDILFNPIRFTSNQPNEALLSSESKLDWKYPPVARVWWTGGVKNAAREDNFQRTMSCNGSCLTKEGWTRVQRLPQDMLHVWDASCWTSVLDRLGDWPLDQASSSVLAVNLQHFSHCKRIYKLIRRGIIIINSSLIITRNSIINHLQGQGFEKIRTRHR